MRAVKSTIEMCGKLKREAGCEAVFIGASGWYILFRRNLTLNLRQYVQYALNSTHGYLLKRWVGTLKPTFANGSIQESAGFGFGKPVHHSGVGSLQIACEHHM